MRTVPRIRRAAPGLAELRCFDYVRGRYAASGLEVDRNAWDATWYVAASGGALLATASMLSAALWPSMRRSLPASRLYPREVGHRLEHPDGASQIGRLAASPGNLPELLRLMDFLFGVWAGGRTATLLLEVHPRHVRFYVRRYGLVAIGPERLHVCGKPAVLLALDRARGGC